MRSNDLTPWFKISDKYFPVRGGWYDIRYGTPDTGYTYGRWKFDGTDSPDIAGDLYIVGSKPNLEWRGLAHRPVVRVALRVKEFVTQRITNG